jgi:hypothetical protein
LEPLKRRADRLEPYLRAFLRSIAERHVIDQDRERIQCSEGSTDCRRIVFPIRDRAHELGPRRNTGRLYALEDARGGAHFDASSPIAFMTTSSGNRNAEAT